MVLPPRRRNAWNRLISAAFGEEMKVVEAIHNDVLRVEEVTAPVRHVVIREFSLDPGADS
jgi:hypothetical protein